MRHTSFRIGLLVFVFLIFLSFPLFNNNLNYVKDFENLENRSMAAKPKLNTRAFDTYIEEYERYYNDNFSIRFMLVKFFNWFNVDVLKKSPLPDRLVLGKNGWLFFGGYEALTYRGIERLSETDLKSIKTELEYRQEYLKKRGCTFYIAIAPVKSNIYSDQIQHNKYLRGQQTWGEQVIHYLNAHSTVKPINLFDRLRSQARKDVLYFKLDDHWNQLGGFYAVNEILKCISKDFPSVTTNKLDDYIIKKHFTDTGNLLEMISNIKGMKDTVVQLQPKSGFKAKEVPLVNYPVIESFSDPDEYEKDREIAGSKQAKILIISDSFGLNTYPFLSEQFRRSVKIFDAWEYKLNEEIVEVEKPDIQLLILWEANIKSLLAHQSRPKH